MMKLFQVNEAEKYRAEDERQREVIAARNSLESYCFNMKSTMEDEKFKDKLPEADKNTILDKCNETINWLDVNQLAEKEEYEEKQKEIEKVCNPIITKLYGQTGGMPGGFPGGPGGPAPGAGGAAPGAGTGSGPTIEEVD
jgi:L1 cell adhesion molecule like protein